MFPLKRNGPFGIIYGVDGIFQEEVCTKGQHLNGFMDYHVPYHVRVMVDKQASLSIAVVLQTAKTH